MVLALCGAALLNYTISVFADLTLQPTTVLITANSDSNNATTTSSTPKQPQETSPTKPTTVPITANSDSNNATTTSSTPKQPQERLSTTATSTQPIYTIELPVTGNSESERTDCFTKALKQVLIQNSDNPQITTLPIIEAALTQPNNYIQRYTYVKREITPKQSSLFLQIKFDKTAITNLLQQTLPTPPPSTNTDENSHHALVWLVKKNSGNYTIQNESSNDVIVPILKRAAQNDKIAIILPVLDLQELNNLKASAICSLHSEAIKTASKRYGASTIITGCVEKPTTNNKWISQWLLLTDNTTNTYSFEASSADDIITQAMHTIAPLLPNTVKLSANQSNKLTLRITNVKGLNQCNNVIQYLTTFSQITQTNLIKINPSSIELSITVTGDQQNLLTALSKQHKLIRPANTLTTPSSVDLDFKWIYINNEQPQTTSAKPVS